MKIALECAKNVKGRTAPNPAVGALIVKNSQIVGRGATAAAGQNHAEINALLEAGDLAKDADLYVTLEPCSHYGRTPPCTDAIIKAGVKRVVVAAFDPNPLVNQKGISLLREAGIKVKTGVLEKEATRLNEDFFWYISHKKPFVAAKLALTLDNKIADYAGSSKWITGEESLKYAHFLRSVYTSIAVGKNTLDADDPKLTARGIEGAKNPVRIVFSSDKNAGKNSFFRKNAKNCRSIIALNSKEKYKETDGDGVEIWALGTDNYKDAFVEFLQTAASEGIDSVFLEGGAKLITSALETGGVNRLFLFYAPKILGGFSHGLQLGAPRSLESSLNLRDIETLLLGNDFLISGRLD